MFKYLSSQCRHLERAWDCATGNGQAALGLAQYFKHVVASDASHKQILNAVHHDKIRYLIAQAESVPLRAHSLDLVMVAQALHWLDFPKFYPEVRRLLKPRGIIAASCYNWTHITTDIDATMTFFQNEVVGPYWTLERLHVDNRYRTIPFPFDEISPSPFMMEQFWDMDRLIGYLETWSATQQYKNSTGKNPLDVIREDLTRAWQTAAEKKRILWNIHLRVGKV